MINLIGNICIFRAFKIKYCLSSYKSVLLWASLSSFFFKSKEHLSSKMDFPFKALSEYVISVMQSVHLGSFDCAPLLDSGGQQWESELCVDMQGSVLVGWWCASRAADRQKKSLSQTFSLLFSLSVSHSCSSAQISSLGNRSLSHKELRLVPAAAFPPSCPYPQAKGISKHWMCLEYDFKVVVAQRCLIFLTPEHTLFYTTPSICCVLISRMR